MISSAAARARRATPVGSDHHRGRRALHKPGDDQRVARRRETVGGRGERERRQAGEEDAAPAAPVTEPPAGHQPQ
jgi:hypothetical protein